MQTIGVAVAIPEPYASQLRDLRESFGDRRALTVPTHVTLLPPTPVDEESLRTVEKHLAAVAELHPAFPMRLRGTGTFRPVSPVVFVAVAVGICECELLAQDVRTGLLTAEPEFPYHPHVTVAHDLDDQALDLAFDTLASYECDFDVTAFVLYVHDEEKGWEERRAFDLCKPPLQDAAAAAAVGG